jgi:hypothetical protein
MTWNSAAVGQPTGDLRCCGQRMQNIEPGIYECRRCDCNVISNDGVIEHVTRCTGH